MKTIEVTSCGDCPFFANREEFYGSDSCKIDPGPPPRFRGSRWKGVEVMLFKVPLECPLRDVAVQVKLAKTAKLAKPKVSKPASKPKKSPSKTK
jgi:hypothetical protein